MSARALYVGRESHIPDNACLDCGKVLDMATGVGHRRKAKPGGITICFSCGHIQALDGKLKFRELTSEEMHDIAGDPAILAVQVARGEYAKLKEKRDAQAKEAAAAQRGEEDAV